MTHDTAPIDAVVVYEGKVKCPHCRDGWLTDVKDSRMTTIRNIAGVRRRRVCNSCGERASTIEVGEIEFDRLFAKQTAKLQLAIRIVEMIDEEVRAELVKRLNQAYEGPSDITRQ